jgi:hypothetical protein
VRGFTNRNIDRAFGFCLQVYRDGGTPQDVVQRCFFPLILEDVDEVFALFEQQGMPRKTAEELAGDAQRKKNEGEQQCQ